MELAIVWTTKIWNMFGEDFAKVARECLQVVLELLMDCLSRLRSYCSKVIMFKILVPITVGKDLWSEYSSHCILWQNHFILQHSASWCRKWLNCIQKWLPWEMVAKELAITSFWGNSAYSLKVLCSLLTTTQCMEHMKTITIFFILLWG